MGQTTLAVSAGGAVQQHGRHVVVLCLFSYQGGYMAQVKKQTITFTVRTTPEQAERAKELASRRGIGRSRLVVNLLEECFQAAGLTTQPIPQREEAHAQP